MTDHIDGARANTVTSMIVSYVEAGGIADDQKKLTRLGYLITMESGLELEVDYIRKKVELLWNEREKMRRKDWLMANVFGKELPDPRFRMGSGLCPRCRRFKNFQKECPLCSHLEMTL